MSRSQRIVDRAREFAERHAMRAPVLLAPMAGACPTSLSIAVANAGGMGACGALLMQAEQIEGWVKAFRAASDGSLQLNTWIPDPAPLEDVENERRWRDLLRGWEVNMGAEAAVFEAGPAPDFTTQCQAMLDAAPTVISSIMGVYPPDMVQAMKQRDIAWFATATTVNEARLAEAAGADVIVAQGMEAGGHRGSFQAAEAESTQVGLFSLLPAIVEAVELPVVATGGIADARSAAAALLLGASAVQVGTGFLRADESGISPVWADAIGRSAPEDTTTTRAFSGRLGRSIRTRYVEQALGEDAPVPAPYPVQRSLTRSMRDAAMRNGQLDGMQAWAGQSAMRARAVPASAIVDELWLGAQEWFR